MENIIFGPVISRRFGTSLGVDLSPETKRCNFDCLYCELAPKEALLESDTTLEVSDIIESLQKALREHNNIDVITITANGEPTMYPRFPQLVEALQVFRDNYTLLILTNSATLEDKTTFEALLSFDQVKCSLDAVTPSLFEKIDRPHKSISIASIISALQRFDKAFSGELVIEVLVVAGINDSFEEMQKIAEVIRPLDIKRLDLGTIDRPPAYGVQPVSNERLESLAEAFEGINIHIAKRKTQTTTNLQHFSMQEIINTLDKRPFSKEDVEKLFDATSKSYLDTLVAQAEVVLEDGFYRLRKNIDKKREKA